MKNIGFFLIVILVLTTSVLTAQNTKNTFYGMWAMEIEDGYVGWLEVHKKDGFLDASLLWKWGSVMPVAHVYFIDEDNLVVTRTREFIKSKEGEKERKHVVTEIYKFKKNGDKISGYLLEPLRDGMGITKTTFKGWKLPDIVKTPDLSKVKYGKPIKLINKKSLKGWKLIDPNKTNGFQVIDGVLENNPVHVDGKKISYGNLRTEKEFEDFNLKLEVQVPLHSNSGVYLRGMYEIQVSDSYGKALDSHNMGALYSRITPSQAAEKPAGEWQTMDITLYKRYVTVILNGKKIIDNQPVKGPTGGAISADVLKPGPIYLQGDHGKIFYRNMVLTPINN